MWFIIFLVVVILAWGAYGYVKGKPHGLGTEGIKCGMSGLFGMRKLNKMILEKQVREYESRNRNSSL